MFNNYEFESNHKQCDRLKCLNDKYMVKEQRTILFSHTIMLVYLITLVIDSQGW